MAPVREDFAIRPHRGGWRERIRLEQLVHGTGALVRRAPAALTGRPLGRLLRIPAVTSLGRRLDGERNLARLGLGLPVAYGGGAVAYLVAPVEPSWGLLVALVVIGLVSLRLFSSGSIRPVLAAAACAAAFGGLAAKFEAVRVSAPIVGVGLGTTTLSGWVERVEVRGDKGLRVTLRVLALEGLEAGELPYRVRVAVRQKLESVPKPGAAISLRVRLSPPPQPAEPGGYNFARNAWFDRIGGVGFAISTPETLGDPPPLPLWLRLSVRLEKIRGTIGDRVAGHLPGVSGAIVTALITGERGTIPETVLEDLRNAGLAHVLAISGLHMAVLAGSIFWFVRLVLAAVPAIVLRLPVKAIAAAAALGGAAFYLLISGGSLATQRAFIMLVLMLLSTMFARPAISLRNVALAALIILAWTPHAVLDVGFQMSFAAVAALVAAYEALRGDGVAERRAQRTPSVISDLPSIIGKPTRFILGIGLTTIIASLAVAPFAAYHFHKLAQFSLVANLLVVPVVTLLVMPLTLMSVLMMPFGAEALALALVDPLIVWSLDSANMVAGWPTAARPISEMTPWAMALIVGGGLWLIVMRTSWRAFGLVLVALGVAVAPLKERPDVIVGEKGTPVAIRLADGSLSATKRSARNFGWKNWLESDGDLRDAKQAATGRGFACDEHGCTARVRDLILAMPRQPSALRSDCRRAAIVITRFALTDPCPGARLTVDARALKHHGTHQIFVAENGQIAVRTVHGARRQRPWSRPPERARRRKLPDQTSRRETATTLTRP